MSTKGKEYKLAIKIAGEIDKSFGTSLSTANSTLKATVASINTDFTKLDKGFHSTMKIGKKCFSAIATASEVAAAAVAAATFASLKVGNEYESAFAGVKKTVTATEEEFAQLRKDIIEISKEIPSSASEIAEVMEIAGQLGIAKDSLTDFTKTMINMGVSTNLEAATSADMFARFANITNMANYDEKGISNYERLGSVVVDLGNNFATTEEEIVTMATNLAATGDMVGLSHAQIMALATSMSATGIKAEKGGSAMSKLLKKIQLAVETNSESLNDYAVVANMTGEQFAKTFKEDSIVALSAFIDGLNDTERNGASAIAVLNNMGLSEVRLSDVILRLANSEGLMTKAIDMANTAWEGNTALSEEAGKRYETFGSQLTIMKNTFEALGIAAYDNLTRQPALEAINNITEAVNEFTENDLPGWIDKINTSLPTMQRRVKNAWKIVSVFFNGILEFGKWNAKNPEVITGLIAGIGSALIAYKIASTITHIVNGIMALTAMPFAPWILGIAGAIAVVSGAIVAYKIHEKKLADQSLEEHFGNIVLSMRDIQSIAEHIVSSGNLIKVKEALGAFDELDSISGTIDEYVKEINKLNWKVSIGMELTEDENEAYKQTISEYVNKAQEYALQSQYAVSLNIAAGFEGTDLEGSDIVDKINGFYENKYDELSALGTKLNEAVTEAFNDGLLEIDEVNKIAELQRQIANIQEQLATGELQAELMLIESKYSSAELDADSFKSLQEELAEQMQEVQEAYDEAYVKNVSAAKASLSGDDLDSALKALEENRIDQAADLQAQSLAFQLNTIMSAYSDELQEFNSTVDSIMDKWTSDEYASDWETRPVVMADAIFQDISDATDKKTALAVAELLESMEPSLEQAEELKAKYRELGLEIPEELNQALADAESLGGMTVYKKLYGWGGNKDDLYQVILQQFSNDEELADIKETLEGYGWEFPDAMSTGVTNGIEEAKENLLPVIEGMYAWSTETIDEYYANGFDVDADVRISLNPVYSKAVDATRLLPNDSFFALGTSKLPGHADGGIFTTPHIAQFAENGPESAIPLDGSRNAISLWEKTGKLLGMDSFLDRYPIEDAGNTTAIEYSPTLQFYGEAPTKQDLEDAMEAAQDKFNVMIERYFKTHGRVSFR